jgi:hypothetical protein
MELIPVQLRNFVYNIKTENAGLKMEAEEEFKQIYSQANSSMNFLSNYRNMMPFEAYSMQYSIVQDHRQAGVVCPQAISSGFRV